MHLHGFHFRLVARGDSRAETIFPEDARPLAVTEHMEPGSKFRMEWEPLRSGHWLFHCHFLDHIVPAVDRDEEQRNHDLHDVERHALDAMGGLVLGITVAERTAESEASPSARLQLVAREERRENGTLARGFALGEGPEGVAGTSSFSAPGPPLLLTRGETTEIVVTNRLTEPTTIHWHGLELESVYDGVAGWSRTGTRIAPLVAPGGSFAVRIRPPRAGTFIYHTHMDETDQLVQGMAGPILVLEPGATFDPETDRVLLIWGQTDGDYRVTINSRTDSAPQELRAGATYRLRVVVITRGGGTDVALTRGGAPERWRAEAKDGADLPPALRVESAAVLRANTGETFDFSWTPKEAGDVELTVRYHPFFETEEAVAKRLFRVR
jgi:FtsP/CotA-like multicopper oxidase with cupredoxin domain